MQGEVKLLLALLPKYAAHVAKYPHTLLIKFYGLHRVRPLKGAKVCQVLFPTRCPGSLQAPDAVGMWHVQHVVNSKTE